MIDYNKDIHTKENGWFTIKEAIEYLKPKIELSNRRIREFIDELRLEEEGLVVRKFDLRTKKQGGEILIHIKGLKRIIVYTDKTKDLQKGFMQEFVKEGYVFSPDLPLIKKIELLTSHSHT